MHTGVLYMYKAKCALETELFLEHILISDFYKIGSLISTRQNVL